jgi:hypothetical protein
MNHPINKIVGITLSAFAALLIAQPGFAQQGGSPASGSIAASGANAGQQNNTDGMTTQHGAIGLTDVQNYQGLTNPTQAPTSRGGLATTTTGNLAADKSVGGSTDMSPFPSGNFNYGFPNGGQQVYMYQSNPGMSPGLPKVSTGSVDFNTVDCPFIAPLGDQTPADGMAAQVFAAPTPNTAPPVNNFLNNNNTSTQQALQQLGTFFGLP